MCENVSSLLESVANDICDNYCKYPDIYKPEENDGVELCESEICQNCPLNRL